MTRMKESGIDWIGQIPQEWEVKDIKHIFEEIGSGATPKSDNETFYDGDINWIQSGDLYQTEKVIKVSKTITYQGFQSTSALKIYKHPFIALAMYGASVGNVAISCIDACVNQAVVVMLGTSEKVRFGKYATAHPLTLTERLSAWILLKKSDQVPATPSRPLLQARRNASDQSRHCTPATTGSARTAAQDAGAGHTATP